MAGAPGSGTEAELEAMQQIFDILYALPQADSPARVLRWACDRFGVTIPSAGEGAP